MTVTGVAKIRDRGPDDLNYNILVVAEGFTAAEQAAFQSAATTFVNDLFSFEPFATEVSAGINVHRLDVASTVSATTLTCGGGPGNTDFLVEICSGGLNRLITVDNTLVTTAADAWVPDWDSIIVVVNSTEYGGSGAAPVAVYSLGTPTTVPIHELGHAAFGLADEYEYWAGCASGETTQNNYPFGEPSEPNVTTNTDRATIKWGSFIDPATPLPTTSNPNCAQCDTQASPVPTGTVGAFEGGRYYHCGIYRPEYDCMMRTNGVVLCAVCQDSIAGQVRAIFSDCFVAGAVYGEPMHPDVVAIRAWRDRYLQPRSAWRPAMAAFVAVYERIGPPLARWVVRRPRVAAGIRDLVLAPFARRLRS